MIGAIAGLLTAELAKKVAVSAGISLAGGMIADSIRKGGEKEETPEERQYREASQSVQNFNNQVQR